jgi:hypothetical protein
MADNKEICVLRTNIQNHPNLQLCSTSSNEEQNKILKAFINNMMNLEQATRRLIRTIEAQDSYVEFRNASGRVTCQQPGRQGMTGLREVEPILSRTAINHLKREVHAAPQLVKSGNLSELHFAE